MAKSRRPLSDTLGEDLTPEMEAFRKGALPVQEQPVSVATPARLPLLTEADEAPASKGKNRKLVVELEPDLYDAFATACFQKKIKMAKLVRQWVEDYSNINQ
jgi:hypothetical protein